MLDVSTLLDDLRRAALAGPNEGEYLRDQVERAVAEEMARDPYGLALVLSAERRTLNAAFNSWTEREEAWRRAKSAATASLTEQLAYLETTLGDIAKAHRKRTGEATLRLPNGAEVATREFKDADVRIADAAAFVAALPEGAAALLSEPQPDKLVTARAKEYALAALEETGLALPGVEVLPAGRISATVKDGDA